MKIIKVLINKYSLKHLNVPKLKFTHLPLVVQVRVEPHRARPRGPELDLGWTLGVAIGEVEIELKHASSVRSLRGPKRMSV